MIVTDNSPNLVLVVVMGALIATGVYLLLERSLTRVLLGVALIGNGVNLLILVAGGAAGGPPLIGDSDEPMSDPLPQALVLTAIVITLGFTAFILAMAYRSWQLHGHDEIQDDVEDRRIARRAERGELDTRTDEAGPNRALEAAQVRDETEELAPELAPEALGTSPAEGHEEHPVPEAHAKDPRHASPSGTADDDEGEGEGDAAGDGEPTQGEAPGEAADGEAGHETTEGEAPHEATDGATRPHEAPDRETADRDAADRGAVDGETPDGGPRPGGDTR